MSKVERTLRFAIMIDSYSLAKWKVDCIKELINMENLTLCFILMNKKNNKRHLPVSSFYNHISNKFVRSLKKFDMKMLVKDVPIATPTDIVRIEKQELDFILNFNEAKVEGEILKVPRYGVWAFEHHDEQCYLGGPAGFWEMFNKDFVTGVVLYKCTDYVERHIILKKGYFTTAPESLVKNKDHIYSAIVKWPGFVCRDILNNHANYFHHSPTVSDAKIVSDPTMKQTMLFLKQLIKLNAQNIFNKLFRYEFWNIGIIHQPINELLKEVSPKINWLVPQENVYYADPFGYRKEGQIQILMEELDHKVVDGYISQLSLPLKKSGVPSIDSAIMRLPSHMSYPYIVEYGGETYCVPETSEEREVALYKLDQTNQEWRKHKILIENFPGIDSTLVQKGGCWWLFCTKAFENMDSHNNELHIFYANDLFAEWVPHSLNPVKIDSRSSRPAGTPFIHEGKLYRPAQDCSQTYGGRVVMNYVQTLTPTRFHEIPSSHVNPRKDSAYPDGLHTISSVGDITILDGKRFDYHFTHFFKKLYRFKPGEVSKSFKTSNTSEEPDIKST